MISRTLKILSTTALLAGALAACTPVYTTPHGGSLRAETARGTQNLYRTSDGRVFPTRAARESYLRRVEARERAAYEQDLRQQRGLNRSQRATRREAQRARDQRRLDRLEQERVRAERRRAKAERAQRQARRDAHRAREANQARDRQQALATARRNTERAEQAAIQAERRAARQARRNNQIRQRQQRVDDLAPRPRLSKAVRQKISRYKSYRRPGENIPAFVTRIAQAERRSGKEGQTVAFWLNDRNQNQRRGASER